MKTVFGRTSSALSALPHRKPSSGLSGRVAFSLVLTGMVSWIPHSIAADKKTERLTRRMAAQDIKKVDSASIKKSIRVDRAKIYRKPQGRPGRVLRPMESVDRSTYFKLIQDKKRPGRLLLLFRSRDRDLILKPDMGLVAQFNSEPHIEVMPSFFTEASWPKAAKKVLLRYKGTKRTERNKIMGEITYHVCSVSKKRCQRQNQQITFELEDLGAPQKAARKRVPAARSTTKRAK